jgi:hypothetical protein
MKRGRPIKYSTKTSKHVIDYIAKCAEKEEFPTIEGLASYLKVGTRTIYDWKAEYEDFSQTIGKLMDAQRELLINNGLVGKYNTRFSMFLLKANHGMREKDPLIDATQNNNFNGVSAELLADALELMESRDGQ